MLTITSPGGTLTVNASTGQYEYTAKSGLTSAINEQFTYTITDNDGDTATSTLTVTVALPPAAPVVLDLGSPGIEYLPADHGVSYNFAFGLSDTAWVGPEDGILAYDYNQDGSISEAKEIAFTLWSPGASTDMEALRVHFDTDQDSILSSTDDAWSDFGVWVDADSDGVQQVGEFRYLTEVGIESISLVYNADSAPRTSADGDVTIFGQSTFAWDEAHGGGTGTAEDVAFAIDSITPIATVDPLAIQESPLDPPVHPDGEPGSTHSSEGTGESQDDIPHDAVDLSADSVPAVDLGLPQPIESADDSDSFSALIDHVLANPSLLAPDAMVEAGDDVDSDVNIPDAVNVDSDVHDISALVDQLVAENPVTDDHLAEYQHEITHTDPALDTNLDAGLEDGSAVWTPPPWMGFRPPTVRIPTTCRRMIRWPTTTLWWMTAASTTSTTTPAVWVDLLSESADYVSRITASGDRGGFFVQVPSVAFRSVLRRGLRRTIAPP